MSARGERRARTDAAVVAAWDLHNDDDISTEQLLARVISDTGCDVSRVIEAMVRVGRFVEKKP